MEDETEVKIGARNSRMDKANLQAAHAAIVAAGAECEGDNNVKGWVTINGAHVEIGDDGEPASGSQLDKGGSGDSGGGKGWKTPRDEFRFVERRLNAGGLKRGEKIMLERRRERLAKEVLGVTD